MSYLMNISSFLLYNSNLQLSIIPIKIVYLHKCAALILSNCMSKIVEFLSYTQKAHPKKALECASENIVLNSSLRILLCLKVSKSVLAGKIYSALVVDLHYLNNDLVANGNDVLDLFNSLLVKLGDVNKSVLAGSNLDKCTEVHELYYLTTVDSADLGIVCNGVNDLESLACVVDINTADEYVAVVIDIYLYQSAEIFWITFPP